MNYRLLAVLFFPLCLMAQNEEESEKPDLKDGFTYFTERQITYSDGTTPLWLNANKYGLSSLTKFNQYSRTRFERKIETDSLCRWGVGYGLDVAYGSHFTSDFIFQQAYAEVRWLKGTLTVGAKEEPMELKNNRLSSGSQTLGINARPVPQVRLALRDYYTLPFLNGWLHLKGHIAYGLMTDDGWQRRFTKHEKKYTDNLRYHSKAGYLKIGNDYKFCPFSLELGLEMIGFYGGTTHLFSASGEETVVKNDNGLKAMWNAFLPGGSDKGETTYKNVEGDQLGSWLLRANWDADRWGVSVYADKFFEDHSSMLQLDYDGYGEGDEWDKKKKSRYLLYDFKDIMLGVELRLKYRRLINNIVLEYISTEYQSGPIYHDHTNTISDHIGGDDNFYNHYMYPGLQHWGQVIGNPLYRSPIYNKDGDISVKDNRFTAWHLGFSGDPFRNFSYRALLSWQEGLGTYAEPFMDKQRNTSFLVEAKYDFSWKFLKNWSVKAAYAMDFGKILGNNSGFQITVSSWGNFFPKHKRK